MQFRTEIKPSIMPFDIRHEHNLLSMGSCFTEHIGEKLTKAKFITCHNPFGIIYNPISMAACLSYLLSDKIFSDQDIFFHNHRYHSFLHHSSFSDTTAAATLQKMNNQLAEGRLFLATADRLLLTFGTAQVFSTKKELQIVTNCHKLPQYLFDKRRLGVDEIVTSFLPVFSALKEHSPSLKVILTVSPVRHLREGFVENQRSKAALLLAVEALEAEFDFVHYFPAYELLLDDLRDYRFYGDDLIHPNSQAIGYIWEHFEQRFFSTNTQRIIRDVRAIQTAAAHRPFDSQSLDYQQFAKVNLAKIAHLQQSFPMLNFDQEKAVFSFSV